MNLIISAVDYYQGLEVTVNLVTIYQVLLTALFMGCLLGMVYYLRLNLKMLNKITKETTENKEVLQTVFKTKIKQEALQQLIRLLATCGRFNSYDERGLLIDFLPVMLTSRLKRSEIANVDIQNMVTGINNMNGDNLKAFLENIHNQLLGSQSIVEFENIMDKINRSS